MLLQTTLDRQIFDEQNQLRTDPQSFIPKLQDRLNSFTGMNFNPGSGLPQVTTIEGPGAVVESINALNAQKALPPLEWSEGLALAARDHCLDAGRYGLVGYIGSDGSTPPDRIERYGKAGFYQGQNLTYGSPQHGYDIVAQLLIDDGVPSRTSRQIVFNPNWTLTGLATCAHSTRTIMTSIVYARSFEMNEQGKAKLSALIKQNPVFKKPDNMEADFVPQKAEVPKIVGSDLDWAIFVEQNNLRTDPKSFIPILKEMNKTFKGQEPTAVLDAIKAIEQIDNKLSPLEWNDGLALAARDHCKDIGPKGLIGHFGSKGTSPYDRILRYGQAGWWRAENMAFSAPPAETWTELTEQAKKIVMNLFIDDGFSSREHRMRLVNPDFKVAGIASCPHRYLKYLSVVDYAESMRVNQLAEEEIKKFARHPNTAVLNMVTAKTQQTTPQEVPVTQTEKNAVDFPEEPTFIGEKRCTNLPESIVSNKECEIFDELNRLRTNPQSLMPLFDMRMEEFEAVNLESSRFVSKLPTARLTKEYHRTVKEAIESLKEQKPVRKLIWSDALFLAARDHCNDTGLAGKVGSIGADGSTPFSRIRRYAAAQGYQAENLVYKSITPLDIVFEMFIGGPDARGATYNLSTEAIQYAGVSSCAHASREQVTVIDFAGNLQPNRRTNNHLAQIMADNANLESSEATRERERAVKLNEKLQKKLAELKKKEEEVNRAHNKQQARQQLKEIADEKDEVIHHLVNGQEETKPVRHAEELIHLDEVDEQDPAIQKKTHKLSKFQRKYNKIRRKLLKSKNTLKAVIKEKEELDHELHWLSSEKDKADKLNETQLSLEYSISIEAFELEVEKLDRRIKETRDQVDILELNQKMLNQMTKTMEKEIEESKEGKRLTKIQEATAAHIKAKTEAIYEEDVRMRKQAKVVASQVASRIERELLLKKEKEMLVKVKEAEKFTREEEATREAAESARSALEFAKHYVAKAKKQVKEEAKAKKQMRKVEMLKEFKLEFKLEKIVKTAPAPPAVSKVIDLSKNDVIAKALSMLEDPEVIPEAEEEVEVAVVPAPVKVEVKIPEKEEPHHEGSNTKGHDHHGHGSHHQEKPSKPTTPTKDLKSRAKTEAAKRVQEFLRQMDQEDALIQEAAAKVSQEEQDMMTVEKLVNEDKKNTEKVAVKSEAVDELGDIDAQFAENPDEIEESILDDDENFLEGTWNGRALSSISDKLSAVLFGQSDKLAL